MCPSGHAQIITQTSRARMQGRGLVQNWTALLVGGYSTGLRFDGGCTDGLHFWGSGKSQGREPNQQGLNPSFARMSSRSHIRVHRWPGHCTDMRHHQKKSLRVRWQGFFQAQNGEEWARHYSLKTRTRASHGFESTFCRLQSWMQSWQVTRLPFWWMLEVWGGYSR